MKKDPSRNPSPWLSVAAVLLAACGGTASTPTPSPAGAEGAETSGAEASPTHVDASARHVDDPEGPALPVMLTDAQIMTFVLAELIESPAVAAHHVDVEVENGVATLKGRVDDLLAERTAVAIAKNVRGVRSVIDELTVAPSGASDHQIRRAVENAFLFDPSIDETRVSVSVEHGIATLTGTVTSVARSGIADDVAASVAGVRGVTNELEVTPAPMPTGDELLRDLVTAYAASATIDDGLMNVEVDGSEVILSGFIGSAAERDRARELAYLAGAASVNDEGLQVQWWRRDEMARDEDDHDDTWIRTGIAAAIGLDPRIDEDDSVTVTVSRGVVTLTGAVGDLLAARAARRVAEDTAGARRVYSFIRVRPHEEVSDATLKHRVEARLAADPHADAFDMTADVRHGVLTLMGIVHSNFERERAEEVASAVDGLLAIDNRLEVRQPVRYLTDVELAHDVASKLERDAWVASGSVVVSAVAGVVSLRGSVASPYARRRAIEDAYLAGATRVDADALVVR